MSLTHLKEGNPPIESFIVYFRLYPFPLIKYQSAIARINVIEDVWTSEGGNTAYYSDGPQHEDEGVGKGLLLIE